MEAREFNELLPDYILGQLTDTQMVSFEKYLKSNPEAIAIVKEWQSITSLELATPSPSSEMDTSFYAALKQEIEQEQIHNDTVVTNSSKLISMRSWRTNVFKGVAAAAILILGVFLGNKFGSGTIPNEGENDAFAKADTQSVLDAENETQEVRSQLVFALADQPSASKRLQAVSEVNKMSNANDQVIMALFKMLNSDPNVNVRLAAVTSLSKYVDNPKVREGLVMSITKQESPLVQIALAELMVTLKEQKSIDSMETLLQQPDINAAVKMKLEESIKRII
jgi:anti-sigma-K factor RskA